MSLLGKLNGDRERLHVKAELDDHEQYDALSDVDFDADHQRVEADSPEHFVAPDDAVVPAPCHRHRRLRQNSRPHLRVIMRNSRDGEGENPEP